MDVHRQRRPPSDAVKGTEQKIKPSFPQAQAKQKQNDREVALMQWYWDFIV